MSSMANTPESCIYLDYNATTPIWNEVADTMKPYLKEFGNPSSNHPYGRTCAEAVQLARSQVAALIGAQPEEIYFCSCGTEADNWAIWGTVAAARRRHPGIKPHVVTSAVEHPAVLQYLSALRDMDILEYTAVSVDDEGFVDIKEVEDVLTDATCLVTIMHANNEVGTLQPVSEIAAIARNRNILIHTDAAQAVGKIKVHVNELGVNMCTVVGHKIGAPKGIAVLYIKDGTQIDRFLHGGGQERGMRAGTENVLLAVGMGKAAEIARIELEENHRRMAELRNDLCDALLRGLPEGSARVNGPADPSKRLPNTLNISIRGIVGTVLLHELSEQVAASAGSACHASNGGVSSVLWAMGVPRDWAIGTLRLSVGRHTTPNDVQIGAELLLRRIRKSLNN